MKPLTTFVTTLGGQPQIITFQLDLLLARGIEVNQVVIILLSTNPRCQDAYRKLAGEFAGDQYADRIIRLRSVPVRIGSEHLAQVNEPAQVEALRRTIHDLLADLKAEKHTIHLGVSGGRRIMALVALAAAMQYLEPSDQIWHLHTPDEVREKVQGGAMMHVPADFGVRLVPVPFVPWVAYFPGLAPLMQRSTPEMLSARFDWLDEKDRGRCRIVWESLTNRQKDVLRGLAEGLERKEIAKRLGVAVSTIDSHREAVLLRCEQVWTEQGEVFNVHYWADKFSPFLRELSQS